MPGSAALSFEATSQSDWARVLESSTAVASYDVTITTYDRPSRLVFEASGKPDLTITYTLRPTSDGTELKNELDFRPRGSLKLLFPLLAPVIRRDVPKQYGSLKALCER
jgi:hypothetical protein